MGGSKDIVERYKDFHWGNPARKVIRVEDRLVPDATQMGPLSQLYVTDHDGNAGVLGFPANCHAAFDPQHPAERIHLVCTAAKRRETAELFRAALESGVRAESLSTIAKRAGGRQADHSYPRVRCIDLGIVTDIVYGPTDKKGDGLSEYIHHFGIEGDEAHVVNGIQPRLAADEEGRLWLAGGDYTVPDEGITG